MSDSPYRKDPRPIEPKVGWFRKVFRAIKEYEMSTNLANTLQLTVVAIATAFSLYFIVFHMQNCFVKNAESGCVSKAYDIEQYRKSYSIVECDHSQQKITSKEVNGVKYFVCECQDVKGDAGVQEKQDEQVP